MGLMEKIRELLHQHDDKVDQGIEKAGEMAKSKVEGHDEQIDQAVDKLQQMTGDGDTTEPKPPGTAPPDATPGGQEPPPPR
ncbi:antitoxin [Pseudonocardia alaniniphila]|uniref:Antitoxin n=1 Tax=Pseudonocardia alaniniphila TaxID=75291 RepID=A0ABS9TKD6_9PSEU|nr:antitoxin [Pseudonocardia alaniniphila]MCH6168999.1 antitoxin [Pseudonocardia alaniniphila]